MAKKIILFELNEVPWRVIEDFTRDYPHTTLAKLLPQMKKFSTHTEDDELNPWATWPSVHRGISDKHHTIQNFGQNLEEINKAYPSVWEIVSRAGLSTGVFGSFHSYPLPDDLNGYDYFVPDVFAVGSECFPKEIEKFQAWQLAMARNSARSVDRSLPKSETLRFLLGIPQLGLKVSTLTNLGRQILDERRENWRKTRRRTHQVLIAFDVFHKLLRKNKPSFATFFSNHVASSMHRYWAAKYPRDYEEYNYTDDWQTTYSHEIDWTMGQFDRMFSRLVSFVDRQRDYQLWVASSMGQAATRADNVIHSQYYLLHPERFMRHFGFEPEDYELRPAMLPRVIVALKNADRAQEFIDATKNVTISPDHQVVVQELGEAAFRVSPPVLQNHTGTTILVNGAEMPAASLGFENSPVDDTSGMTAYHIREGSLVIYDPSSSDHHDEAPKNILSTDITPMILRDLGLEISPYMNSDIVI